MAIDGDPLDEPGYQEFLAETAKGCCSRVQRPCPGCCSGGMCDGFLERDEDDKDDASHGISYDEDIDAE